MRTGRTIAAMAIGVVLLAACSGESGDITGLPKPDRVQVSVPVTEFFVGQAVQAQALALDGAGAELASGDATWSTDNPAVLQVSESGLVLAVAAGSATLRATVAGKTGTLALVVQETPVNVGTINMPGLVFTPATITVKLYATVRFVFPTLAHNVIFGTAVPGAPADIPSTVSTTVSRQFNSFGDFAYDCTLHPGMVGVVRVR